MRRVVALVVGLTVSGTAWAAAPALLGVSQEHRHPTVTLAAPGANDVTVYIAKKPNRATDGSFLNENIKDLDLLTADEIATGRWKDAAQIDPGV